MRHTFRNENDVKTEVKDILKEFGWWGWPNAAGPQSVVGLSDRMALHDGVLYAIECKFGTNPLRASQRAFLRNIQLNGGEALVVTDRNIALFREFVAFRSNVGRRHRPVAETRLAVHESAAVPQALVYSEKSGAA